MTKEHIQAFIHEAEEGITELNNALLALEGDPDDESAMDGIFRTAHTLKGNAAAMGFSDASGLAHALEDLLDEVRDDEIEITPELMDLLFDGVDELELMLGEIAEHGESHTDPSETERRVREAIEAGGVGGDDGDDPADDGTTADGAGSAETAGEDDAAGLLSAENVEAIAALASEGDRVFDARVSVGDSAMKGVDGMFVVGTAEDAFDAFETTPDRDAIEDGQYDEGFDLFVAAESGERVESVLGGVSQTESVTVSDVTGALAGGGSGAGAGADSAVAAAPAESADSSAGSADTRSEPAADASVAHSTEGAVGANGHASDGSRESTEAGDGAEDGPEGEVDGDTADADVTDPGGAAGTDAPVDAEHDGADDDGADGADGVGSTGESDGAVDAGDSGAAEDGADADDPTGPGDGDDSAGEPADSSGASPSGGDSSGTRDDITSVRVDVDRLDDLYGLVEQLVTSRIKLRREMEAAGIDKSENLDELDKISSNLQNTVMDMRLIPLKKVVNTFPRMVRDVARDQGKDVEFTIEGEEIELDRTILTEIRDPLMHILRNAVDHGIETPEVREAAGKPPQGSVELTATRERDHVNIRVADDGAGLDVDRLREKAVEKGVKTESELAEMADADVYDLVFHPGFSTSEEVTDISGRGVGMDVVHSTVKQLDGTVNVDSEPGEGTTVTLRLPVTVAIVKVMFVKVGDAEYGIPVKNIDEVARTGEVHTVNGREVIEHGDEIYPVVRLHEELDDPAARATGPAATPATDGGIAADGAAAGGPGDSGAAVGGGNRGDGHGHGSAAGGSGGMLLRIRPEKRPVALHCDAVLDQEEVVVKPLEGVLSGIPGLSGTAVLGDGDVVPILDVVTL